MFDSLCFQSVIASWFLSLLLFFFSCNYTNHHYNTCNYIHINILLQQKCNVHSTRYILLTLSTCNISEFDNKVIFQQIFDFFYQRKLILHVLNFKSCYLWSILIQNVMLKIKIWFCQKKHSIICNKKAQKRNNSECVQCIWFFLLLNTSNMYLYMLLCNEEVGIVYSLFEYCLCPIFTSKLG